VRGKRGSLVEHGRLAAESLDFRKRRRGSEEAVVSKLRKLSRAGHLTFHALRTRED
jgi:hypothetical protein